MAERDSYEVVRSSLPTHKVYGPHRLIDGLNTGTNSYFLTANNGPKPWVEIQLSSEVAGVSGLEIQSSLPATKYLGNLRISAGTQPTAMVDGEKGLTVDHVNTYIGMFKGPEGGGKTIYVSFPQPLSVKYILLQKDSLSNVQLAGQEVKVLVGTLYCPDDYDRGVEAGARQDFKLNFFKNSFTYSCGAGRKFSGLEVQTLTNSCQLRSGCQGVCWEFTNSSKLPACIREYLF